MTPTCPFTHHAAVRTAASLPAREARIARRRAAVDRALSLRRAAAANATTPDHGDQVRRSLSFLMVFRCMERMEVCGGRLNLLPDSELPHLPVCVG